MPFPPSADVLHCNPMNTLAVIISGSQFLNALVILVIAALIFWLLLWFIRYVGVPEPFNKVIKVVVGLVALIFLINFLLSIIGKDFIRW